MRKRFIWKTKYCNVFIIKGEFIIASMAILKYLEIEEFRQFSASNEAYPPIKHFEQSSEFMHAFEMDDFGSVNVRFYTTVDRTDTKTIGVRSRIVASVKN